MHFILLDLFQLSPSHPLTHPQIPPKSPFFINVEYRPPSLAFRDHPCQFKLLSKDFLRLIFAPVFCTVGLHMPNNDHFAWDMVLPRIACHTVDFLAGIHDAYTGIHQTRHSFPRCDDNRTGVAAGY